MNQSIDRVTEATFQKIGELVLGNRQVPGDVRLDRRLVPLEFHAQRLFALATVERQHPVMRDLADRFGMIEVIAIGLPFFGRRVDGRARQPAVFPGQLAGQGTNLGVFADALGENVGGSGQNFERSWGDLSRY